VKNFSITQISIFLLSICLLGCLEDNDYKSYKDQKRKGEKAFHVDLKSCQDFSNLNIKRSEGSKAAGELLLEKNFLINNCMKRNYWIKKNEN